MNKNTQESTAWESCRPGELQQMVSRQVQHRRRRQMMNVGGSVAVLLVCVLAGWMLGGFVDNSPSGQFDYGGILCQDVRPLMGDYQAGILDAQRAEQVKAHLEQCPHCSEAYRKMYGSVQTTATLVAFGHQMALQMPSVLASVL